MVKWTIASKDKGLNLIGVAMMMVMVVVINLIMLILLELPTIAYTVAPETTPARVFRRRCQEWADRPALRRMARCHVAVGQVAEVRCDEPAVREPGGLG